MNNDQLKILRDEIYNDPLSIGYINMTYEQIVESLNSSGLSIPNPDPQPLIPIPVDIVTVLGLLTTQEKISILGNGTFKNLYIRILTQGDSLSANAIMAFIATDPNTPFETVTIYTLATRLVELQRVDLLYALIEILVQDGKLSENTVNNLLLMLQETQLDPDWTEFIPTLSRRKILNLPEITNVDIQRIF